MSFQQLNKDVLKQVAEDFAVDLEEDATKKEIIAALEEDGVTWNMYKQAFPSEEEQPDVPADEAIKVVNDDELADPDAVNANAVEDEKEVEPEVQFKKPASKVLLKMTRANGTFQIRGYKFTSAHPYLPVAEDDANYILENIEGFKIASPREAEEFYS